MDIAEFDELKMYFAEDYVVNSKITIHQPTIGEIVEFGEKKYFQAVYTLCAIPSDMKSFLEDIGINYMEIDDFEFFCIIATGLNVDDTRLLFGDLDFSKFRPMQSAENGDLVFLNVEDDIVIDKLAYLKIVHYLRKLHGIKPKIEHAYNETTRKILIKLDRDRIEKNKNKPYKSNMKEYISAMMRYPGFKYKTTELKQCGYYEFMDTVIGAQLYVSSTALLKGAYSGMIDTSKINKKEFNWMRSSSES